VQLCSSSNVIHAQWSQGSIGICQKATYLPKTSTIKIYRPASPAQHAQFLHVQYVSAVLAAEERKKRPTHADTQEDCDAFCNDA